MTRVEQEWFSLGEAKRELAKRECMSLGHDWRVVELLGAGPVGIVCERCGETHKVEAS